MKKNLLIFVFMFLILTSGCCKNKTDTKGDSTVNIQFDTGVFQDKNWTEKLGTYDQDVIPTKEVAVEVATQIFKGMSKSSKLEKYVPQSVFFDEVDNVWIVSFWESQNNNELLSVGNDCNIAIRKNDGQILRIWFGE